jgi:hypothetical protein
MPVPPQSSLKSFSRAPWIIKLLQAFTWSSFNVYLHVWPVKLDGFTESFLSPNSTEFKHSALAASLGFMNMIEYPVSEVDDELLLILAMVPI